MNVTRFGSGASLRSAITASAARGAMSSRRLIRRATAAEGVPDGARMA
ncbi:MAG: hypothetical protein HOQ12_11200 [Gemmatimonadaceae bacterium]|nr:hypothetical protein [Gemmatimonadaceae bacterium]NUQ93702.1 hypothetical protein [Gemmatimonadaceae bacterium]NUR20087.1 hypothetical protein [Gemmatimonadaceae bacterium]